MLTPEQTSALAESIVSAHEQALVSDILDRLVRSLVSGGELLIKDQRLLETAAAMNRDEVAKILATYNRSISKDTRSAVADVLKASDAGDVDILSSLYALSLPSGSTAAFALMAQQTADGVAAIIARNNLKMAYQAQQLWYDVAGEAIVAYNHGGTSIDKIMSRAVSRLSRDGLKTIDYASGVKSDIDVAIRRHVVTQVSQASARMTMARLDQYGHDLVYTSSHFGARPDHAIWQGKAFSRSGRTKGYSDLVSETGYGTVTGLLGANCGHQMYPYFEGITTLPELPERVNGMTNDEMYEATQKQRGYERAIRQTKREAALLQKAGLDDTQARLKLGNQQRRLKAFCDKKGLTRQPGREKGYGIGRQPRGLKKDPRPKVLRLPDRPSNIMEGMSIALPEGGYGRVAPETFVTEIEVFAGRGTSTPFRKAGSYAAEFGGTPSQWRHTKGYARVYDGAGVAKRANVHWYEEPTTGVVRPFVKGWSKKQ